MTDETSGKDLIVLVADKNMEAAFRGILSRHEALHIRRLTFDIYTHPNKDPGCKNDAHQYLRAFSRQYNFALVAFDREGCGSEHSREDIENGVEEGLNPVGWENRCRAIVLDPELEVWLWTRSPHVDVALGWENQQETLRNWLTEQRFINNPTEKPTRPKEAVEAALRKVRKPRSSSIYEQIARRVSLEGHQEPAFLKLYTTLQSWFGEVE